MAMPRAVPILMQAFRLGVLVAIAWMIRQHHLREVVQGDRPITISEVKAFLPETHTLRPDDSPRQGLNVLNAQGEKIGYAARTMPHSREIAGYSGPTDALIVLDAKDQVVGVKIRHSYDTPSHVSDVQGDFVFMETWNGKPWDEVAKLQDLQRSGIYGVSGATRTSEAVAKSVAYRAALGEGTAVKQAARFGWQDAGLILVTVAGCALAFVKRPWLQKRKRWLCIGIFLYLGVLSGDLLAQSLLIGWAEGGVPWRVTPGLVILAATAFLVPWGTRQPVYCTYICPHGHAQRWLMKVLPAKWMLTVPEDAKWGLKAMPFLLLCVVLATTFLSLPLDLAGIEPFDAYVIRSAGVATIAIAVLGLAASLFVPMAYCKYGCPTGFLLDMVRKHGGNQWITAKDYLALALLILAMVLYFGGEALNAWIVS